MIRRTFAAFVAVALFFTQAAFAELPRSAGPARQLFQSLDTDRDGRLSPWEFESATPPADVASPDSDGEFRRPPIGPQPPFRPAPFDPPPATRRGAGGGPEGFLPRPPLGPPPVPEELFDRLDEDEDGRLSRKEFLDGLPPAPPSASNRSRRSRPEGFVPPQRPSGPFLPPELEARLRALETELRSLRVDKEVR